MEAVPYKIIHYENFQGSRPYTEWLSKLRDKVGVGLIGAHVDRMKLGHFGKSRHVGEGIWELKIHWGPGYRIYYMNERERIIILLCGGDKDSQNRDIDRAKYFAEDYRRRR